jgi:hypothetical protein
MRIRNLLLAAGLIGLLRLSAPAQEPKGALPPDVVPSTFRMFLVTDGRFEPLKDEEGMFLKGPDGKPIPSPKNRQGKVHCLVCENGLAPMLVAFVRTDPGSLGADSGVAKLAKGLNTLIPKYRSDKLSGFFAFLALEGGTKVVTVKTKQADGTELEQKVEQDKEYPDDEKRAVYVNDIQKFAEALMVPNVPFGLAPTTSKAVTEWGIKPTDEVTVILYHRLRRVGQPWTFAKAADLTDDKVNEILKAVEAEINGRTETLGKK